nr:MAG TPA: hypothetical protein [Caudoviricetes sp.]
MTRSGGIRAHPGVSPGLPGVCFSVCGYFGVVIFAVCAGQACWCLFSLAVFVCLCVGVLVACACVCARVCWCWCWCVRVFDGVGHVVCCGLWVDAAVFVWRMFGASATQPRWWGGSKGAMR